MVRKIRNNEAKRRQDKETNSDAEHGNEKHVCKLLGAGGKEYKSVLDDITYIYLSQGQWV